MDLQYVTRTRTGGPGPASPPAKSFEFLGSFPPAYGIERTAMGHAGGLQSHLPPVTPVNTKLTRASEG